MFVDGGGEEHKYPITVLGVLVQEHCELSKSGVGDCDGMGDLEVVVHISCDVPPDVPTDQVTKVFLCMRTEYPPRRLTRDIINRHRAIVR